MSYFSDAEILLSVLYALLLGCALGVLRRVYLIVLKNGRRLLMLPVVACRTSRAPSADLIKKEHRKSARGRVPTALSEVFEFLYFFFCGIAYILLSYLALDGYLRLYTALFTLIGAVLVGRLLQKTLDRLTEYLLDKLLYILLVFLTLLGVPIRRITGLLYRHVCLPIYRLLLRAFFGIRTVCFIHRRLKLERSYFYGKNGREFALNTQKKKRKVVHFSQKRKRQDLSS